jgi:7-cyano-7-deazaguanine synthase in queuosine biosynthesis
MSKNIVVWSGGADSTLVLCNLAYTGAEVTAITVTNHSFCNKEQFKCQEKAQNNFKKFAEEKEWNIKYETVSITGSATAGDSYMRQGYLWITQLLPYFGHGDVVHWGYTSDDTGFWHTAHLLYKLLDAADSYRGAKTYHEFPLENLSKVDIMRWLRGHYVPKSCVWTCEKPNKGKHCGVCRKCTLLYEACLELNAKKKPQTKKPIARFESLISW